MPPRLSRHARQQLIELPATLQTVDTSPERCALAKTLPVDERAKLFLALMRRDGLSQMEAAQRCGVQSSTILRTLRAAGHVTTTELARLRRFVESGQRAARAGLTEAEMTAYRLVMQHLTRLPPSSRKRVLRFVRLALQDTKVLQHARAVPPE